VSFVVVDFFNHKGHKGTRRKASEEAHPASSR
jgi:hypothetical protein